MKRGSLVVIAMLVGSLVACGGAQIPAGPPVAGASLADAGAADPAVAKGDAPGSEEDALVPIGLTDPTWGARTALVTIVEFSDFQCPYCAQGEITLAQLKASYGPEKLRVVWKNEPLAFHPNARPAAEAALGVFSLGGNDAFWRFHEAAFKNQSDLSGEAYERWAETIGVDVAQLRRGLLAHTWVAKIERDQALARQLGVDGTPAFFINGVAITGAQPIAVFQQVIDAEILKANTLVASGVPRGRVYATAVAANAKNPPPPEKDDGDEDDAPDTHVYRIPIDKAPIRGPKDAPITIVEYSDFECPYCRLVEPTLAQVRAHYGDKVRIVWKNLPLPFHAHAMSAAELAVEARAQKGDAGFWAAHDKLYEGQSHLEDSDLEAMASALGLDAKRVKSAIATERHKHAIEADIDEADAFRAAGTPHFFVNGRRLVGAQPFDAFRALIDDELVRANAELAKGIAAAALYDALTKDGTGPPTPEKKIVAPAPNAPARGAGAAKVVIQEFSDFQCPFCKRVQPTLDLVLKSYAGRVKIVWRHLPLPFHADAMPAAEAASEAYKQKGAAGFWKMHDLLFAGQATPNGLKREAIDGYAKEIGLDVAKLDAALDAHLHKAAIDADAKAASDAGIHGTPGFVINGYFVSGAQPYAAFRRAVERALAERGAAR